jgi:hypothetical protein
MEAAAESDNRRAIGVTACDLDRILDGFGTGGQEDALMGGAFADQRIQPLCQSNIGLVGGDLKGGVGDEIELLANRRQHARMVRAVHDDRMGGQYAARHILAAGGEELCGRFGTGRHGESSSAAAVRQSIWRSRLPSPRPRKVPKIVRIQHLLSSRAAPTAADVVANGSCSVSCRREYDHARTRRIAGVPAIARTGRHDRRSRADRALRC